MPTKNRGGRPAVFGPKDKKNHKLRVQGILTSRGRSLFEVARKKLAKLAGFKGECSDGDTIEFLSRGEAETKDYINERS